MYESIHIHKYTYVCIHVCMYVCVYIYIYIRVHIYIYIYVYIYIYIHIHTYIHVYIYTYTYILNVYYVDHLNQTTINIQTQHNIIWVRPVFKSSCLTCSSRPWDI